MNYKGWVVKGRDCDPFPYGSCEQHGIIMVVFGVIEGVRLASALT